MYVFSYFLNYSIFTASLFYCVLNSVFYIITLLDQTGNCQVFLSSCLFKLAVVSLTSFIFFNNAVMKASRRTLRSNQGFPLTSQACRNLESSCHLLRVQRYSDVEAETEISCSGSPGFCPVLGTTQEQRLKTTTEQGITRTWTSASTEVEASTKVIES